MHSIKIKNNRESLPHQTHAYPPSLFEPRALQPASTKPIAAITNEPNLLMYHPDSGATQGDSRLHHVDTHHLSSHRAFLSRRRRTHCQFNRLLRKLQLNPSSSNDPRPKWQPTPPASTAQLTRVLNEQLENRAAHLDLGNKWKTSLPYSIQWKEKKKEGIRGYNLETAIFFQVLICFEFEEGSRGAFFIRADRLKMGKRRDVEQKMACTRRLATVTERKAKSLDVKEYC